MLGDETSLELTLSLFLSFSLSNLRCASKEENRKISLADSDMENKFEQKEKTRVHLNRIKLKG